MDIHPIFLLGEFLFFNLLIHLFKSDVSLELKLHLLCQNFAGLVTIDYFKVVFIPALEERTLPVESHL